MHAQRRRKRVAVRNLRLSAQDMDELFAVVDQSATFLAGLVDNLLGSSRLVAGGVRARGCAAAAGCQPRTIGDLLVPHRAPATSRDRPCSAVREE
jgi:hypothetical protein